MENRMKKVGKVSSFLTKYIGVIIICFSVIAFFWRDGFAWTTSYTSVFLGVAMFGMGLTIKMDDFKRVFSRPKEILIGFVAQYTIMPVIAWILCQLMQLPTDLALGVILVGCCPGGTASNVITYIAGGDVALSVGMTITSTLAAPIVTPLLVYVLAGAWVEGILLGNGNFCSKGCSGSGTSGNSDQLGLGEADPENIRDSATDLSCIDRNDHQRNRSRQCRKNLKLRTSGSRSCDASQSLRNGNRTWRSENFTY